MGNFFPPWSRSGFRIQIHWPDWIRIQSSNPDLDPKHWFHPIVTYRTVIVKLEKKLFLFNNIFNTPVSLDDIFITLSVFVIFLHIVKPIHCLQTLFFLMSLTCVPLRWQTVFRSHREQHVPACPGVEQILLKVYSYFFAFEGIISDLTFIKEKSTSFIFELAFYTCLVKAFKN